jgi:amino-acid N-acetyltransferase
VQDVSLLHAMGMRIVVVHGARPQINEQLRLRGVTSRYASGLRITDPVALECAKEASGEMRLDIEAAFSQGLPNTPMAHSEIRVLSGNLVSARPVGIVDGVDFQHTGVVRKVDAQTIRFALNSGAIALVSNLGFSPTGEAFNLNMEDVAASTAIALDADKLVFVTETRGVLDAAGEVIGEISEAQAGLLLAQGTLPPDTAVYLKHALRACEGGVARAHIIPFSLDGSVLLELFQHDGVGTMVVEETLEALREAGGRDVGGVLALIRPLEEDGTLVKRDRALIESEIENFTVIEHDGVIFGCAALYAYPEERIGEMACLAVNPHVQNKGDGERLLTRIEQRARAAGLRRLFVLTTRTMHWFLKRGFVQADVDALPRERRNLYNWQRKSQVLVKDL